MPLGSPGHRDGQLVARSRSPFRSGARSCDPVHREPESARVWPRPSPKRVVPIATPNSRHKQRTPTPRHAFATRRFSARALSTTRPPSTLTEAGNSPSKTRTCNRLVNSERKARHRGATVAPPPGTQTAPAVSRGRSNATGRARTSNLRFRRPMLYPIELQSLARGRIIPGSATAVRPPPVPQGRGRLW